MFTRSAEGSRHKVVKATMTIQASPHAAVALVRDTDACQEWAAICKESYEAEVVSDTELYVSIFRGQYHTGMHWRMSSGSRIRTVAQSQCSPGLRKTGWERSMVRSVS